MRTWTLLCLWLGLVSAGDVCARGKWPVEAWVSQEIGAAHDNNFITQLPDGRVLISNLGGLLAYDGARWRFWNHPDRLPRLGPLALLGDRIYTSYTGDLGYYEPNGRGAFQWQSLASLLPEPVAGLGQNMHVAVHAGQVYYLFNRALLRYDIQKQQLTVLARGQSLTSGAFAAGEYWFNRDGELLVVAGDEVRPGPQSLGNLGVGSLFEDAHGTWVVGGQKLYRRPPGGATFEPFAVDQWPRFARQVLVRMEPTSYGYALLYRDGPLELIDAGGQLLDRIGNADGLPDNPQRALIEDRDGALWVVQQRTIARIDRARGVTRYDASLGLKGADELIRWQGDLVTSDSNALFRLQPGDSPGRFVRELGDLPQVTCVAALGDRLLVAGSQLLVAEYTAGPLQATSVAVPGMRLCTHLQASRRVGRAWLMHNGGLARIDLIDGAVQVTPMPQFTEATAALAEEGEQIWVADRAGRLWRSPVEPGPAPIESFDATHDLPKGTIRPHAGQNRTWFATVQGLRLFDRELQRFVVPSGIPEGFATRRVFSLLEDTTGTLWLRGDAGNIALHPDASGYRRGDELLGVDTTRTIMNFLREDQVLWLARSDDILRIDLAAQRPLAPPLQPLVAKVIDPATGKGVELIDAPTLASAVRSLNFSFSVPSFERASQNVYRTRMSSVDADYTGWSASGERQFTNLGDGEHLFEIEAEDVFGRVSALPAVRIRIAAPWYRSTTAYLGYVLAGLLALLAAARWGAVRRSRALMVRQRELETTVAERTAELHQKNAQLAEQADRLLAIDRLKTRFFTNVGHEFRTPLTLVLGPLDDLLRDTRERLSERVRAQLQLAQRNARRVLDLIVELLDVNRLEHGQLPLSTARQDLRPLLQRVALENAPLAERFGQTLVVDVAGATPAIGDIDPLQIERALGNLIGNAAKYSPRGTGIALTLSRDGDHWLIAVRDQGRGIAPEALPHVFDRFFQTEGSSTASGYGIGLSLVREIAQAHGGTVSASSTLGVGSTFELRLPAVAMPDTAASGPTLVLAASDGDEGQGSLSEPVPGAPPPAAPSGDAPTERQRERVLVVDDHDDLRGRVREILGHRFEVIEAADGNAAWQLARDELPDLIVSDVMMPGCDGVELSKRLRSHPDTQAIGILLLTAKVGSEHAVAGLQAGANDYLAKPFDASELLARCEAIVAHARRLQHRLAASATPVTETPVETPDTRWRQRLDQHIAAHLHDPEFSIEALARCMHADRTQLFRKCKDSLGQSPSDYLRDARLAHGHRLLEQAAGSISEVAYASGFDSLSSFTRAFKARYGVPPSQVRGRAA